MNNGIGRRRVVVVVGNPRRGSRTTALAEAVGRQMRDALDDVVMETIELADLADGLFDPQDHRCRAAEEVVTTAAALVVASPVYKATYTGLLKAFLDRLSTGGLDGMPSAAVMLGGSEAHSLAVEVHLRPLLAELGANTLPACYMTEQGLDHLDQDVSTWWARARRSFPTPSPTMKGRTDVVHNAG